MKILKLTDEEYEVVMYALEGHTCFGRNSEENRYGEELHEKWNIGNQYMKIMTISGKIFKRMLSKSKLVK